MLFSRTRECQACAELREELVKLRSRLDALLLDWETQQDKVHRWMQRTSARARTEEREAATVPSEQQLSREGLAAAPTVDPVSAKILARRSRRPAHTAVIPLEKQNGEES